MTNSDFLRLLDTLQKQEAAILENKGKDYTIGSEDRLDNFKRNAEHMGLKPKQVCYVYLSKHLDAIASYIKFGKVESEPIEERIADARNYLFLLFALIKDEQYIEAIHSGEEACHADE